MNRYNKNKNTIFVEVQKKKEKQNIHSCSPLHHPCLYDIGKYSILVSFTLGKDTCPTASAQIQSTKDSSQSEPRSKSLPLFGECDGGGMAANIYNSVFVPVLFTYPPSHFYSPKSTSVFPIPLN